MSLSAKGRRDKGVAGEREVKRIFEGAGYQVRGLEGEGDHLVMLSPIPAIPMLHVESKRQEQIKILAWSRQAEAEAPSGALALVAYRPSREPWRVSMPLVDLVDLLLAYGGVISDHHEVHDGHNVLIGDKCPICRPDLLR